MATKQRVKTCPVCGGSGVHRAYDTSGRVNAETNCGKCWGVGTITEKYHVPDKKKSNSKKNAGNKQESDWTDTLGVIAFIGSSAYLYSEEILGGFESIIAGVVIGLITKFTVKWVITIGLLYLGYEIFLKQ